MIARVGVGCDPLLAGRYRLLGELTRGGMGVIYRASDEVLDREVAVKLLQDRFDPTTTTASRFVDEARIAGQLQHPGIPAVHDLGTLPDGRPFLVMRLIKGRTLAQWLGDAGPGAPGLIAAFEQVCQAVGYAHSRRVIHRDLKPGNVMIGAFGEVQVMDWGLAKVLPAGRAAGPDTADGDPEETQTFGTEVRSLREAGHGTQAGSLLGTPAYMPPEQAIGAVDQVDERADVFGLGAILCTILTGRPPYVAADAEATRQLAARAKLDEAAGRLDACGAEPALVALCRRCLAPEKSDRPADAGAVAAAVASLRAAADERARRAELDRVRLEGERARAEAEAREQRKRRRVQLALAAAVGLLLAGVGAFAWWLDREATSRALVERGRLARNTDAVAALLSRCEDALRADDAHDAARLLDLAERRAAEGGSDRLAGRLARCRADLALLRELNSIDEFRWSVVDQSRPGRYVILSRWRAALAGHGIVPGETLADEATRRVAGSLLRERLIATLDLWLALGPSPGIRDILGAADPDPFRDAVRGASAAWDDRRVIELVDQPEAIAQPPGFAAAVGNHRAPIPLARRRQVLETALRGRPGDLGLLMALGGTYPINQREGASERLRWFQAAVAAHPRNVEALIGLGLALTSLGDYEGAVAAITDALRLEPDYSVPRNNLGATLSRIDDPDGAIAAYREAIRLNPKKPIYHYNLGWTLRKKGDLDGAIAAFREAIRLAPSYVDAHENLRACLREKGGPDAAVADSREVLSQNPDNPEAHNALGDALKEQGDLDGAIEAYREAIRLAPRFALAQERLGDALKEQGDLDGAIEAYRAHLRLSPDHPTGLARLRDSLVAKGDIAGAVEAAREAARLFPTASEVHHALGDALQFRQKDPAAAAEAYREAIRLNPVSAWSHNNLGTALRALGDPDGALDEFREALRHDPAHPAAFHNLTGTLLDRGRYDEVVERGREMIGLDPSDANGHTALARALIARGDADEGLEAAREAIRLDPGDGHAHASLGQALQVKGDLDGALAAYEEASRLAPEHAFRRYKIGMILKEKGDHDGAIAAVQRAAELSPGAAYIRTELGIALLDEGDPAAAAASLTLALELDPKNHRAAEPLARLLATGPDGVRDGARAVKLALGACERSGWKSPPLIEILAAAYAEAGQFDKAVETQRKALTMSHPEWGPGRVEDAARRLDLYTQKLPYRDPALAPPEAPLGRGRGATGRRGSSPTATRPAGPRRPGRSRAPDRAGTPSRSRRGGRGRR